MRSRMQFVGVALLSFALGVLVSGNEVGKLFAKFGTIGIGTAYADGDADKADKGDKGEGADGSEGDKSGDDADKDKADEPGEADKGDKKDASSAAEEDPEVKAKLEEFAALRALTKDFPEEVYQKLRQALIDSTDAAIRALTERRTAVQRDADVVKTSHDAELQQVLDEFGEAERRAREKIEAVKRTLVRQAPDSPNYRGFGGDR